MRIKSSTSVALLLFICFLAVLIFSGCARHRDPVENQTPMGQGSLGRSADDKAPQSPQISQAPQGPRIITRSGQDYYVDSNGALHVITRRVIEVPDAGGGLYYIEDDDRPYYIDQSNRLYSRDSTGRTYYIEELRPVRPVEREATPRVPEAYAPMAPARSMESCESQWQSCMSGCNGISPRQPYDRPNCIRNCDVIRNGCLGR